MLLFLLLAQATAGAPALDFDLAKLTPATPSCHPGTQSAGGEIVVCAQRHVETDIPIKPMPEAQLLPKAEFKLFGKVRGKVSGERGNIGPIPTNRAMVTMTVPF